MFLDKKDASQESQGKRFTVFNELWTSQAILCVKSSCHAVDLSCHTILSLCVCQYIVKADRRLGEDESRTPG